MFGALAGALGGMAGGGGQPQQNQGFWGGSPLMAMANQMYGQQPNSGITMSGGGFTGLGPGGFNRGGTMGDIYGGGGDGGMMHPQVIVNGPDGWYKSHPGAAWTGPNGERLPEGQDPPGYENPKAKWQQMIDQAGNNPPVGIVPKPHLGFGGEWGQGTTGSPFSRFGAAHDSLMGRLGGLYNRAPMMSGPGGMSMSRGLPDMGMFYGAGQKRPRLQPMADTSQMGNISEGGSTYAQQPTDGANVASGYTQQQRGAY